jgi:carbon storage regulator CsrA
MKYITPESDATPAAAHSSSGTLFLDRKIGQGVTLEIDGVTVTVMVCRRVGSRVRLGFTAPRAVQIWRSELLPVVRPAGGG